VAPLIDLKQALGQLDQRALQEKPMPLRSRVAVASLSSPHSR
jgi:hypothetical protein